MSLNNDKKEKTSGECICEWEEHINMDMDKQGDVERIKNWRNSHSIDDLKKYAEKKDYSAFSIGSFDFAYFKKFNYQITIHDCEPTKGYASGYINSFWIYNNPKLKNIMYKKCSENSQPPVNFADLCRDENLESIKRLIDQGADINQTDENGRNGLLVAVTEGKHDIIKYLHSKNSRLVHATHSGQMVKTVGKTQILGQF